jgi:hypothetical protein
VKEGGWQSDEGASIANARTHGGVSTICSSM